MKSFSLAWLILHALKGIARAIIERKHIGSKCDMGASQKPCQKKAYGTCTGTRAITSPFSRPYKPFFKALQALFQGLLLKLRTLVFGSSIRW